MSVNFYLGSRADRSGDCPIRVSVSMFGQRLTTTTSHKISPAKWDGARHCVRKGCSNAGGITYNTINAELARIAGHFAAFENRTIANGTRIDKSALKDEFTSHFGRIGRKKRTEKGAGGFFDCLDRYIKEQTIERQWTWGTRENVVSLRNHLKDFSPNLSFSSLDESTLLAFSTFLRENKGQRNNTIKKNINVLRWFLNWSVKKGYNTNKAFEDFNPKLKTTAKKVHFLTWDELMRVYGHTFDEGLLGQSLSLTRDIFCFCCFTSLRYSDAMNLRWSDIADGAMTITTVKTSATLTIELNKYALGVLDRYRDFPTKGGFVFPRLRCNKMNVRIKQVCELCGINEPTTEVYYKGAERIEITQPKYKFIGTHCGRRTFICNALSLGIPPQVVMKWTGHSDYKAMKPYIDISNAAKATAMAKFNEL